MSISNRDQRVLVRLREAKEAHADLGGLLGFYEELFQELFAFKIRLQGRHKGGNLARKEIDLRSLADGNPQLTFEGLEMDAALFMPPFRSILGLLSRQMDLPRPIAGEPQPEAILEIAREIFCSKGPVVLSDAPLDLTRTAAGFILVPYLQWASEVIMPRIGQGLWHCAYCPVCGGTPSFAALTGEFGSRTLLCSRCNGEWSYRRVGCPFCEGGDSQTFYPSEDGKYRLYLCESCHRYLKTIDLREAGVDVCLPVECLVTVAMDLAAQEKGYSSF